MRKYLLQKLQYQFDNPNYLFFLLSLILMLLAPPLAGIYQGGIILLNISYGLIILISVIYTTSNYRELKICSIIGGILYGLFLMNNSRLVMIHFIQPILTLLFFSLAFRNIIRYILKAKKIGLNEIYACISGYLILGVIATPHFYLVEQMFPNAFTVPPNTNFYDFLYFSYITLTTVGFGDISPIHPLAKAFTLILGIAGQLYLTILMAIIIGKYLAIENLEK